MESRLGRFVPLNKFPPLPKKRIGANSLNDEAVMLLAYADYVRLVGEAIGRCRSIIASSAGSFEAVYVPLTRGADVEQELQVVSPFKRRDLADDMLDAVDIRLFITYPRIEATLHAAHQVLGLLRPTPPFVACLSQLVSRHEVFGGNAFPIVNYQSVDTQLATIHDLILEKLLPLMKKTATVDVFNDDSFQWPSASGDPRWWLYRATKSVTYDSSEESSTMIARAMDMISINPANNYQRVDEGIAALAQRRDERMLKYVTQILGVLSQVGNPTMTS